MLDGLGRRLILIYSVKLFTAIEYGRMQIEKGAKRYQWHKFCPARREAILLHAQKIFNCSIRKGLLKSIFQHALFEIGPQA